MSLAAVRAVLIAVMVASFGTGSASAATVNAQVTSAVAKNVRVLTEKAACMLTKQRVAKLYGLPVSGPPHLGWFCDFATSSDPDLYVIAMHSNRKMESGSSHMGWFAVRKSTGAVGRFDITEEKMLPLSEL